MGAVMVIPSPVVCLLGLIACSATAQSQTVPAGYRQVAQEAGVPSKLLYAVALAESGQSAFSGGAFRPWPWTLNVNGKGRYYRSRQAAWQALQHTLASPEMSVDIGLMQISWRYHQSVLGSGWAALDPYHNLRVAAALLRDCLAAHEHWLPSAGCYHAPNNAYRAEHYSQRVKTHWQRLTDEPQGVVGGAP